MAIFKNVSVKFPTIKRADNEISDNLRNIRVLKIFQIIMIITGPHYSVIRIFAFFQAWGTLEKLVRINTP